MKPLFVANWKMNKLQADAASFCSAFVEACPVDDESSDVGIAPSYLAISAVRDMLSDTAGIMLGSQNCHWLENGAHTGEVSAQMLAESGVQFAIVGHSERRQFYGETSETVAKRARAAIDAGMKAIVCIGESETEFKAKQTEEVVKTQFTQSLAGLNSDDVPNIVVAYEPVWAIGTGLAATPDIAQSVQSLIRGLLVNAFGNEGAGAIPILYGGSTKPDNIASLIAQPDVDGALVGGASLDPKVFADLVINGRKAAA